MTQYLATQVPWGFLGPFLMNAQKTVEDALVAIPGAKLSGLEITLYPKRGAEAPTEEYNLTFGKIGERFVPDDQIIDAGEQQSFRLDSQKRTYVRNSFLNWLITILRMIWLWLLRMLGIRIKDDSTGDSQESQPPSTDDPIQNKLFDIRDELASQPEVAGFAVGVRALITASPTCATGTRCEWNWRRLGWYLRRYYVITSATGTSCGRSWTSTEC
jgi:hypothetical protein